jgi:hypothetical protein
LNVKAAWLLFPFVLVAGAASAGETPAPRYGSLRAGALTSMPERGRPSSIPRRESVEGIFLVVPQWAGQVPVKDREVWIMGSAKDAEAFKTGKNIGVAETAVCFNDEARSLQRHERDETNDPLTLEWGTAGFVAPRASISRRETENGSAVTAVHAERIVEQNGAATLEATDAWVDLSTRGVRLIGRASLPLTLAGTAAGGVKLYVGRDERPNGKKFVQFVMVMGDKAGLPTGPEAWVEHGERVIHGGCRHMRFGLPADQAGDAVFHTQVVLPRDATAAETVTVSSRGRDFVMKETRFRPLAAAVSVSRVSRDPEPVVSVAFSWTGREQRMMLRERGTPGEGHD